MTQIQQYTGLNVHHQIAQLFPFDTLILNKGWHTYEQHSISYTIQKKKRES